MSTKMRRKKPMEWQARDITAQRVRLFRSSKAFYLEGPILIRSGKTLRPLRRKVGSMSYVREFPCPIHPKRTAREAYRQFFRPSKYSWPLEEVEFSCPLHHDLGSWPLGEFVGEMSRRSVSSGILAGTVSIRPRQFVAKGKPTLIWCRIDRARSRTTVAHYQTLMQAVNASRRQHSQLAVIQTKPKVKKLWNAP